MLEMLGLEETVTEDQHAERDPCQRSGELDVGAENARTGEQQQLAAGHEGAAEKDAVPVAEEAVGDETSEHRCEVAQAEEGAVDDGDIRLFHQERIHQAAALDGFGFDVGLDEIELDAGLVRDDVRRKRADAGGIVEFHGDRLRYGFQDGYCMRAHV